MLDPILGRVNKRFMLVRGGQMLAVGMHDEATEHAGCEFTKCS